MARAFVVIATMLLGCSAAVGEEAGLVSGRPGYTDSPGVVGRGVLQVETGLVSERTRSARSFTGPQSLLRAGISRRLEMQLSGDGFSTGGTAGAKVQLADEGRFAPAVAALAGVSVPISARGFPRGGWDPAATLCWTKAAPKGIGLGGSLSLSAVSDSGGRRLERALGFSVGHDLPIALAGFVEWYDPGRTPGQASMLNGGVARPIGKDAQFDISLGRAIRGAESGWVVSAGLTVRRPLWQAR